MSTWIKTCFLAVFLFWGGVLQAEEIASFEARYQIQTDGSVLVEERIDYDFGSLERHGIFRTLTTDHPQPATAWYKRRSIGIEVLEVTVDGREAPFFISESAHEVVVKIGDPDATITGSHGYVLRYVLLGALSYGTDGAEFYFDVTGNGWSVPIRSVVATVTGETTAVLGVRDECYVGAVGATDRCTKGDVEGKRTFSAQSLEPSEGLTIATEVQADAVAVQIVESVELPWLPYTVAFLWLSGLIVWAFRFRRAHKQSQPVIAQYEPYEGVLPMYTGVLLDGRLDPHDITAGIVYLAEQGFLKIKKTEEKVLWVFNTTDYELTWLRADTESLPPMLQSISQLLFTVPAVGATVLVSTLASKRTQNYTIISELQRAVATQLETDGFMFKVFELRFWSKQMLLAVSAGAVVLLYLNPVVFVVTAFLSGTIIILALYKRRTAKGFAALNHLKGFKLFLSVTDKERFAFHNAPEKSPELFMEFLPYAIALKVEKEWAAVFSDITIPNPGWYDGGSMNTFSAVALTSDLGAFSSSFTASSGTSGSSGGGSSGGGGGGGGGGSW